MTIAPLAPPQPVWRSAVASFAPTTARPRLERLLRFAPVVLILVLQAALTLRLTNLANPDEALYIDAGHQYLAQWSGGPAAPDYGSFFSGFPYAYPVFAALIDRVGGLPLVRFASLLMMLGATLCVRSIGEHLAGPVHARRAGLAAMLFSACAAPTLFVGHFATFDAMCCSLVIAAVALAITRRGYLSAVFAGLAVSTAAIAKYTGGAFILVIVVLAVVSAASKRNGIIRGALIAATAGSCLLDVYVLQHKFISGGIAFTTSNRTVENFRSYSFLVHQFVVGAGAITVIAVVGIVLTWHRSHSISLGLTQLVMLAAGLAIPASQLHIHEYTSFNKHLVFLTVFAAPLAGQIVVLRPRLPRLAFMGVAFYIVLVLAVLRSSFMFSEWPDPSPVIAAVNANNVAGKYIGVGADEISYYEKDHRQFSWTEPFGLYGAGPDAVTAALDADTYAGVFYTSGSSGSAALDKQTNLVISLLQSNPDYRLVGSWPKHKYDTDRWYLWVRVSAPPVPVK